MDRGPEVVGHKGNEQVQDFDTSKADQYSIFNENTSALAKMLNGHPEPVKGLTRIIATSKRDGMCGRFFIVRQAVDPELYSFYQKVLRSYNNPFINAFVRASPKGVLIVPASNGTAFLQGEEVWTWFACAIGYSYGLLSEAQLALGSPEVVLESVVDQFVNDLMSLDLPSRACVLFEMICPNRADPFTLKQHTELATGYSEKESGITFLSYSFLTEGRIVNVPHSELNHPFREPSYWVVEGDYMKTIRDLLTGFDNTFSGEATMEELFAQYPRANSDEDKANLPDPEGLVLYAEVDGKLIYLKAKTDKYYLLHKVNVARISTILSLPKAFGLVYPAYNIVHHFFGNTEYINTLIAKVCGIIDDEVMVSQAQERLRKRSWESLPQIAQVNQCMATERFREVAPSTLAAILEIEYSPEQDDLLSKIVRNLVVKNTMTIKDTGASMKFEDVEEVKAIVCERDSVHPLSQIFTLVGGGH